MSSQVLHVREAGSGTPLVLLHAFPLSSEMWREQRNGLAPYAHVLTPDLRGFGRSPLGADAPSLDHLADDVAATLDARGVDRVVLGGLSMGGYVAMAFCRRHPTRLLGLVLADTKASADPPAAREKRERIAARLEAERTPTALVEEVLPALCGPTTRQERPDVVREVRRLVDAAPPGAAAWAQRAMAARPESLEVLRTVEVPALVLLGDEDELATRADAEAMTGALTDSRLEVLRGCGHLSAMEVPDLFTARLREFLIGLG